jgi:hypothetical protein
MSDVLFHIAMVAPNGYVILQGRVSVTGRRHTANRQQWLGDWVNEPLHDGVTIGEHQGQAGWHNRFNAVQVSETRYEINFYESESGAGGSQPLVLVLRGVPHSNEVSVRPTGVLDGHG